MPNRFPDDPPIEKTGATDAQSQLDWEKKLAVKADIVDLMAAHLWPGEGIIAVGAPPFPGLIVHEQDTPSMRVEIDPGLCKIGAEIYGHLDKIITDELIPPTSDPRIDNVEVSEDDNTLQITQGDEAGSPSAPTVSTGFFIIATITHTVAETIIEDADGGEGYITKVEEYANA